MTNEKWKMENESVIAPAPPGFSSLKRDSALPSQTKVYVT